MDPALTIWILYVTLFSSFKTPFILHWDPVSIFIICMGKFYININSFLACVNPALNLTGGFDISGSWMIVWNMSSLFSSLVQSVPGP